MAISQASTPTTLATPGGTQVNLFGVPNATALQSEVPDSNNEYIGVTLSSSSDVSAQTTKLDTLDIVTAEVVDITANIEATPGTGETLTLSPLYPFNIVGEVKLQLESTGITHLANGVLTAQAADIWPVYGPQARGQLQGAGVYASQNAGSYYEEPQNLTPAIIEASPIGTARTVPLTIEIATSMFFDEYFNLAPPSTNSGSTTAQAFSVTGVYSDYLLGPTYMAATNRTVTPKITFNSLLSSSSLENSVVGKAGADTTSTATGSASLSFNRVGYIYNAAIPTGNPPLSNWVPTFNQVEYPTSGQSSVKLQFSNNGATQGQLLAVFGYIWDPALNGGLGGIVPLSSIAGYKLVQGGKVTNIIHGNRGMQRRWQQQHGSTLLNGFFGYDFSIDTWGRVTNAYAINTYTQSNTYLEIDFVSGSAPSSSAYVVTGQKTLQIIVGGSN